MTAGAHQSSGFPATGTGAGKLLLFGEHAAVYGYPAVGMQLPRFLEVRLYGGTEDWEFPQVDERSVRLIRQAVDALPEVTGVKLPACRMDIAGDLPMSVGLGSSAAFCIGLIRAARNARAEDKTPEADGRLWKEAHGLEHVFHGTPSGIDTGLSLLPGAHVIYPRPPAVPQARAIALPPGWLVVGAVPRVSSTAELVAGIRQRRELDPHGTEEKLRSLGEIAANVSSLVPAAGRESITQLGELANRAQETLSTLGLSSGIMEEALSVLREAGAVGAKLSGAGGGGAFFGVFTKKAAAESAAAHLLGWIEAARQALPSGPFVLSMPLYNSN